MFNISREMIEPQFGVQFTFVTVCSFCCCSVPFFFILFWPHMPFSHFLSHDSREQVYYHLLRAVCKCERQFDFALPQGGYVIKRAECKEIDYADYWLKPLLSSLVAACMAILMWKLMKSLLMICHFSYWR